VKLINSVSSGKVVDDYDNKTHRDGKDDDTQMEAMLLTDEKRQKTVRLLPFFDGLHGRFFLGLQYIL
jgi:hypothetical protein